MRRTSVKEAEGNCSVQRRESLATDQPGKGQGEEDKANQKSRQRRFTLQNLAQYRKYGRRTYSNIEYAALTKLNMDPLCALLGMEYEKAGFGTDSIDSSTTSRNRRGKKYGRYTPSVVETNGYTTALGPLLEKRTLHPLERVFLEAAENGDKSTVARCLSFRDKVNVNCVNMLGRTAIQIAVDNENIEIVELLLKQPGIKIGDALLYAIQEGVYRIVEMLINHPSITKEMLGTAWNDNEDLESPEEESHDFSADISPVILAAICNQFEILQLLLNRGARIEEPHKSSCTCAVCLKYLATDPLKHTLQRINTYRALASPAWISLTSPDPILTAFKLSAEMLHLASEENEFKDTFNSLCEQCRKYACDLLDLCRGTNEVVSVLGKSDDSDEDESDSDESEDDPLTRCDQHKDYTVSSSTCQVHEAENTADCFNSTTVGTNNDWRALAAWYDGTKKHHKHKPGHTVHLITDSIMESQHTTAKDPEMDGIPIPTEDQSHVICPNEIDGNRKLFSGLSRTSNLRPDAMCVSQDQTSKCKDDFEPDEFEGAEFSAGTEAESNLFCGSRTDSFGRELDDLTVGRKYFKRYGGNCYKCRRKENGNSEVSGEDSHKGKSKDEASPIFKLDRLKLAIEYEQKKFVAHPHCQHLLTTLWYDQLPGWRKRNGVTRVLLCFAFILTLPVLSIMYLLYPRGKVGRFLRIPLVKFINHSASFAIFIILLLIASMHTENEEYVKARGEVRGPQPNAIELLVLWFVTGFIWGEMKQVWEEGLAGYTRQWWNWLDFIMLCLYTSTVALRVMAFILRKTQQYGNDAAPRPEWPASDPTLFSEALFSIAHIFSFSRIIFLFQINEHLGPLQISLGNMLIDIAKFILIFLLIISSFACGLHQLFYYYISTRDDYRPPAFNSLSASYRTLFWHLFGTSQLAHFEVKRMNPATNQREEFEASDITMIVGEMLLLIYHAMASIVLVNMLIAMMSSSFQKIQNHSDTEWKFARSKLWVGYFDEGSTLPPPLNTIVSPKAILRILRGFYNAIKCSFRKTVACVSRQKRNMEFGFGTAEWNHVGLGRVKTTLAPHVTDAGDEDVHNGAGTTTSKKHTFYQTVMRRLVRRYIHQTKKTMRQDGVNEDDLLEIKQDISSLRCSISPDSQWARPKYLIERLSGFCPTSHPVEVLKTLTGPVLKRCNLGLGGKVRSEEYELREDRKREIARTIGQMEGMKHDLVEELSRVVLKHIPIQPGTPKEAKTVLNCSQNEPAGKNVVHPLAKHESEAEDQESPKRLHFLCKSASEARSEPDPERTYSITYGTESQHMYDEIQQIALMNTAYERTHNVQPRKDSLPFNAFSQLKDDIMTSIREELHNFFRTQAHISPVLPTDAECSEKSRASTQDYHAENDQASSSGLHQNQYNPTTSVPSKEAGKIHSTDSYHSTRQIARQPRHSVTQPTRILEFSSRRNDRGSSSLRRQSQFQTDADQ